MWVFFLFLFLKGPSCWEDVLIPNKITGICQSQNCNGEVAVRECQKYTVAAIKNSISLEEIKQNN